MANKAVPKWKRYREIKKRVHAHVSCKNSDRSFHRIDEDLPSDSSDNELASQVLHEESEAKFNSTNITQNSPSLNFQDEVCQETSFSQEGNVEATGTNTDNSSISWQNTFDNAEEIWSDNSVHENVSSSEPETVENDEIDNLTLKLAKWVTTFGITHSAVNDLLCILRPFHDFFTKRCENTFENLKKI